MYRISLHNLIIHHLKLSLYRNYSQTTRLISKSPVRRVFVWCDHIQDKDTVILINFPIFTKKTDSKY